MGVAFLMGQGGAGVKMASGEFSYTVQGKTDNSLYVAEGIRFIPRIIVITNIGRISYTWGSYNYDEGRWEYNNSSTKNLNDSITVVDENIYSNKLNLIDRFIQTNDGFEFRYAYDRLPSNYGSVSHDSFQLKWYAFE